MAFGFAEEGSILSTIGSIFWLLQLGLLIHVFKTGRPYWWFWVLLVAPLLGGLLYVLVEIVPDLPRPRGGGYLSGLKPRAWRIRELREQLEESDVVRTRLDLAAELLASGDAAAADATAAEALQGVFRKDPLTLIEVARFRLAAGRHAEALELLQRAEIRADRVLEQEKILLEGRACLGLGELPAAEERFRFLLDRYVGDEPRHHLAETLAASGRGPEATALWQDIVKRFRRGSPAWRRTEKTWYRHAKARLKGRAA